MPWRHSSGVQVALHPLGDPFHARFRPRMRREVIREAISSIAGHLDCRSEAWIKGVDAMLARLRDGSIELPIEGVFPMAEASTMFERLASRHVAGKLLLAIG